MDFSKNTKPRLKMFCAATLLALAAKNIQDNEILPVWLV